ncbi:hypothetical protein HBI56_131840 [Parastagonospora nodorum]|nr:hypothetical protein HBI10_153760 [Parastagonospora nodorum]KAH4012605.1 hypothetical protein HBI13_188450 [Parastagonospora nodorum]KAH5062983.1 hypothetical protein HBH95_221920 [Parastagonospora nodorum]KAH5097298.1 hypothetical protein HBH72_129380 [Parastagonospora nodorum]KAH5308208.1 hypothetical protein HBI50_174420 [Parastagonospora nodorum]
MVCPRRQHEDEAEVTDDTSERHHLDSVEMSRLCTDWPRTLDQQRAKAYIALVLAPCSPFSMSNDVCPFLQRCALVALLQLHRVRESPHPARPPSVQNTPSLACLWTLDSGLWSLPCRVMVSRQQGWRCWVLQLQEALSAPLGDRLPVAFIRHFFRSIINECAGARVPWAAASPSFHRNCFNHPFTQSVEGAGGRPRPCGMALRLPPRGCSARTCPRIWQPHRLQEAARNFSSSSIMPLATADHIRLAGWRVGGLAGWRVGATGSSSFRSACSTGRNPSDHAMGPGCPVP